MAIVAPGHRSQSSNSSEIVDAATILHIDVSPTRVARWLAVLLLSVTGVCLLILSLSIALGRPIMFGPARMFDFNEEASIPTFYAVIQLLAAACLLLVIARIERQKGYRHWFYWMILAVGFLYLAADELAAIHEKLNRPLRHLFDLSPNAAAWVVAGGVSVAVVAICFIPFLRALPTRYACLFLAAGFIYVGSAVGVETLSSLMGYGELYTLADAYDWLQSAEEVGEMAGNALFIYALVYYLRAIGGSVRVDF